MKEIKCKNIEELVQKVKEGLNKTQDNFFYFEDSPRTGEMGLVMSPDEEIKSEKDLVYYKTNWMSALKDEEILKIRVNFNADMNAFFNKQLLWTDKEVKTI